LDWPPPPTSKGEEDEWKALIKKELVASGFERTLHARYGGWLTIVAVVASIGVVALIALAPRLSNEVWLDRALPLGIIENFSPDVLRFAITAILGVGGLYLGLQQWRAARSEISLDKFWDRLAATNKKLDEWKVVRRYAGPWDHLAGRKSEESYQCRMYVYLELDSLEYAIAKYRIGYMSYEDAYRSLNTFRQRCKASGEFRRLAREGAEQNVAYDPWTFHVVVEACNWAEKTDEWYEDKKLKVLWEGVKKGRKI
jgi:hypothetical protein